MDPMAYNASTLIKHKEAGRDDEAVYMLGDVETRNGKFGALRHHGPSDDSSSFVVNVDAHLTSGVDGPGCSM